MDDAVVLSWILKPLGGLCWGFAAVCLAHSLVPNADGFALASAGYFGLFFGWFVGKRF